MIPSSLNISFSLLFVFSFWDHSMEVFTGSDSVSLATPEGSTNSWKSRYIPIRFRAPVSRSDLRDDSAAAAAGDDPLSSLDLLANVKLAVFSP